ncbi:DUF6090 family protein [uncultured Algibacter sp.]|uniref:DUF6090 family protein n=1 Tax=uncultured Algibacter sp. TaxID=298659 RepID=UPI0030EE02F2|tara:strand:+ start:911 stop:1684 length:774 start_codon:yes stop_codon:yes gene_type:complete
MIKFFRKIRQNLLTEGKTGKYLKYAIGEIVLVVIGILLALSINNWNENRKANSNQLKYLNLLKKEALSNITSLDIELGRIKKQVEGQKEVFRLIDESKDTLSETYVSQVFFNTFTTLVGFNYKNSVLTEIKNSGELKNIENDSLRLTLIALEPFIEQVKFQENSINTLQKKIIERISRNGDLRIILESVGFNNQLGIGKSKAISKGNKPVLNDDYFKNNMIEYMSVTFNLTDLLYPRIRNQFIDIINKIDKEIDDKK